MQITGGIALAIMLMVLYCLYKYIQLQLKSHGISCITTSANVGESKNNVDKCQSWTLSKTYRPFITKCSKHFCYFLSNVLNMKIPNHFKKWVVQGNFTGSIGWITCAAYFWCVDVTWIKYILLLMFNKRKIYKIYNMLLTVKTSKVDHKCNFYFSEKFFLKFHSTVFVISRYMPAIL